MKTKPLDKLLKEITPLPWRWHWEDASVIALSGPEGETQHVLWSSVCDSCQKSGNRCTAPSDANAAYLAHAANALPALIKAAKIAVERLDEAALYDSWDSEFFGNSAKRLRAAIKKAGAVEIP